MHRVELKEKCFCSLLYLYLVFLMHRVELKAGVIILSFARISAMVPNAPCGVESLGQETEILLGSYSVPNAPCGVESVELND